MDGRARHVAGALVAVAVLGGCGSGPPAGPPPRSSAASGHNDADVMFLQMAVTGHREAAPLLRLVERRAARAELRTLAAAITATQADETARMTGWLRDWGQPTEAAPGAGAHAGHGGLPLLDRQALRELRRARGAEFDAAAVSLLLGQQQRTAELARDERAAGRDAACRELAGRIERSRAAQVELLLGLSAG